MMKLVWTTFLLFCSVGALLKGDDENSSAACFYRLDSFKDVIFKNQDRCSTDVRKSGTNLEKYLQKELKSLEERQSTKADKLFLALSSLVENLANKLDNMTVHLAHCSTWRQKLRNQSIELTQLKTGTYHYNTANQLNWYEARDFCENHGMKLVSFETEEEMNLVAADRPNKQDKSWLLASDIGRQPGQFHWTDGRVVDKSWFSPDNRDNFGPGKETCLYMLQSDGKLCDRSCTEKYNFICEVDAQNSHCV